MNFAGQTYSEQHDKERLSTQFERVLKLMSDGKWRTIGEICEAIGARPESGTGVSARLRQLRTPECGGHTVDSRRRGDPKRGLYEYRLIRADRPAQMRLLG